MCRLLRDVVYGLVALASVEIERFVKEEETGVPQLIPESIEVSLPPRAVADLRRRMNGQRCTPVGQRLSRWEGPEKRAAPQLVREDNAGVSTILLGIGTAQYRCSE